MYAVTNRHSKRPCACGGRLTAFSALLCAVQLTMRRRLASPAGRRCAAPVFVQVAPSGSPLGSARTLFLPSGAVTSDYLPFQCWDSVQGLCSYVRGTVASAAVLQGVGVGDAGATPLSAAVIFMARDLTGHLGGLLFSGLLGTRLDADAKQWRLTADVANNIGLLLNMASAAVPRSAFVPLILLASLAHAITGVAGGATRAALTSHFACSDNAADVAAKEGAQESAVTLCGMLLGYLCVRLDVKAQRVLFALLTILHVYANVKAVRTLRLTLLNQERLCLLAVSFLSSGRVLTPDEVAPRESLLPRCLTLFPTTPRIRLGVPLDALPGGLRAEDADKRVVGDRDNRGVVCIALRNGFDDIPAAYFYALRGLAKGCSLRDSIFEGDDTVPYGERMLWQLFQSKLSLAGWGSALKFNLAGADAGYRFETRRG